MHCPVAVSTDCFLITSSWCLFGYKYVVSCPFEGLLAIVTVGGTLREPRARRESTCEELLVILVLGRVAIVHPSTFRPVVS